MASGHSGIVEPVERLLADDFDGRFARAALLQFARRADRDDLPESTMATRSQRRSASSM